MSIFNFDALKHAVYHIESSDDTIETIQDDLNETEKYLCGQGQTLSQQKGLQFKQFVSQSVEMIWQKCESLKRLGFPSQDILREAKRSIKELKDVSLLFVANADKYDEQKGEVTRELDSMSHKTQLCATKVSSVVLPKWEKKEQKSLKGLMLASSHLDPNSFDATIKDIESRHDENSKAIEESLQESKISREQRAISSDTAWEMRMRRDPTQGPMGDPSKCSIDLWKLQTLEDIDAFTNRPIPEECCYSPNATAEEIEIRLTFAQEYLCRQGSKLPGQKGELFNQHVRHSVWMIWKSCEELRSMEHPSHGISCEAVRLIRQMKHEYKHFLENQQQYDEKKGEVARALDDMSKKLYVHSQELVSKMKTPEPSLKDVVIDKLKDITVGVKKRFERAFKKDSGIATSDTQPWNPGVNE